MSIIINKFNHNQFKMRTKLQEKINSPPSFYNQLKRRRGRRRSTSTAFSVALSKVGSALLPTKTSPSTDKC